MELHCKDRGEFVKGEENIGKNDMFHATYKVEVHSEICD